MPAEEEANEQLREKVRALEEELADQGDRPPPGDERGPTVAATATAAASGEHEDAIVLHRVRFARRTPRRASAAAKWGISVFTDVMAHERGAKADAAAGSDGVGRGRRTHPDARRVHDLPAGQLRSVYERRLGAARGGLYRVGERRGDAADPARLCVYTIGERKFRGGWISQLFAHPPRASRSTWRP